MAYIKVWCEYGSFGGDNNEEVFEVPDDYTSEQIAQILEEKFAYLAEETECEGSLLDEGLMGWEWIGVEQLCIGN